MSRFIEGADRTQTTLFPECLDDYVAEDGPVRVVDVFVDELDLSGLGFKAQPSGTGRPAYHPATLLKIYIYGYLNRIQSSRGLEREAQRNVELMWLTGRLAPDFKTIADFRKDNGKAIRLVCREFVMLCRKLELFSEALVAIDGSKFKAVNNRGRNYTRARMKRRLEQVDEDIDRYLKQVESADRQEGTLAKGKVQRLEQKVEALKAEMARLKRLEVQMLEAPDQQISLTDPDARAMALSPTNSGLVGYNVQSAVDAQHHLIVAHEISNAGSDRKQLFNMASQAKEALGVERLEVVADRGYFKGEEILACERADISAYVPKSLTSGNLAKGFYDKRDFIYKPEDDEYECPAGARLIYRFTGQEQGRNIRRYWSSSCGECNQKSRCTTAQHRRVSRWEHEAVLEAAQERLDASPEHMRIRRSTVEHPFGTIKSWMGHTHFLTRTLPRVATEMSLHVLAYNLKRVMTILGPQSLMEAMRA